MYGSVTSAGERATCSLQRTVHIHCRVMCWCRCLCSLWMGLYVLGAVSCGVERVACDALLLLLVAVLDFGSALSQRAQACEAVLCVAICNV